MQTKYSFLKLLLLSFVGLMLFTSCGSRPEPKPYIFHQDKKAEKTVTLFSQKFALPKEPLHPSKIEINDPYVKVIFDKPTYVSKLLVYQTQVIVDEEGQKLLLYPRKYKIRLDDQNVSDLNTSYYYDTQTLVKIDELNISSNVPHRSLSLAFSDFFNMQEKEKLHLKKYPSLKIDGYVVQNLVFNALSTREDKTLNESLVKAIAQENENLFREIQKSVQSFQLPDNSLADLPQDVDLRYALKHHQKIFKSNRYKSVNGKYKRLNKRENFDSSYTYKSSHKVKIHGKKVKVKRTAKKHKVADYIDFSEGL